MISFKNSFVFLIVSSCLVACNGTPTKLTLDQKATVYLILSETNESYIHKMRGAEKNSVYLGPDGHQEAVYDGEGKLVQDGINDGSYNFAHPVEQPFAHFAEDIEPWIKWGSSPNDPTTVKERIFAYISDVEGGIVSAFQNKEKLNSPDYRESIKSVKTPENLEKIFSSSDVAGVFNLVDGQFEITDENLLTVLGALNAEFNSVY